METWLWAVIGILAAIIAALLIKISGMQKSAAEIENAFAKRLVADTNVLIDISSRDKYMRSLANAVNVQLRTLRAQRHRFVQGDAELKNAVAGISHDLRTPLTAISGYLDLLDGTEKSEDAARYLAVIKNRTDALKQLTEELFCYSVVTSPEYGRDTETVDVNGVLEESLLGFYAEFKQKQITPHISMPESSVMRSVNKAALSRVFANLISNAVKYSGGSFDVTLTESGSITFANACPALSEVEAARLFDRFYTVENAKKSTGLGLSVAKVLTAQMGGTISAEYKNNRLYICMQLPDSHE